MMASFFFDIRTLVRRVLLRGLLHGPHVSNGQGNAKTSVEHVSAACRRAKCGWFLHVLYFRQHIPRAFSNAVHATIRLALGHISTKMPCRIEYRPPLGTEK
eukprot:GEMP01096855.1.p1 GENE.GEMP01096855.1~~GEMP01096855.1.p1  ORF type:complete len:101 (-),score=12.61 GEMP01096855.1:75-377(-)